MFLTVLSSDLIDATPISRLHAQKADLFLQTLPPKSYYRALGKEALPAAVFIVSRGTDLKDFSYEFLKYVRMKIDYLTRLRA